MYNLPLDELIGAIDYALNKGYTVCWDILIFHNTGDVHQVVVSCHKLLVTILTDFRCYVDFRIRMLKLEHTFIYLELSIIFI